MAQPVDKLFNKGFIITTIINFLVFLVYYLLVVIIAVIAQQELHASMSEAGLATGIYIIGTLLARLYFGKKLEIMGRKAVLRVGIVFYLLTTIAYFFMPNLAMMYLVRFLNGFLYGTVSTATNAIVTAYIPADRKGTGINYYGLSTALAAAIGPFVGMILLNATSFKVCLIVSVVLVAIATVMCLTFKVENIQVTPEHARILNSWKLDTLVEKQVMFITGVAFLIGLAYSSVLAFLSTYSNALHLATYGSYFFLVYAGVVSLTRPYTGKMFDNYGEGSVMYPSFIFLGIGLVSMAFMSNGWILLITGAFIGLGYGTFMSNGQAVCLKLVPSGHRVAIALSTYFIGLDLGLGVGPYLLGALKSATSYTTMYLVCAIIAFACVVLYKLFYRGVDAQQLVDIDEPVPAKTAAHA